MQMEGDGKEWEEAGVSRWASEGSLGMKTLALLPVNSSKSSPQGLVRDIPNTT